MPWFRVGNAARPTRKHVIESLPYTWMMRLLSFIGFCKRSLLCLSFAIECYFLSEVIQGPSFAMFYSNLVFMGLMDFSCSFGGDKCFPVFLDGFPTTLELQQTWRCFQTHEQYTLTGKHQLDIFILQIIEFRRDGFNYHFY